MIRGRHTFVFGGDFRLYDQTPYQGGADAGSYSFSPSFTQGPNPLVSSLTAGDAFRVVSDRAMVPAHSIKHLRWRFATATLPCTRTMKSSSPA